MLINTTILYYAKNLRKYQSLPIGYYIIALNEFGSASRRSVEAQVVTK